MSDEAKQEQEETNVETAGDSTNVNVDDIRAQLKDDLLKEFQSETDRRVGKFVDENKELKQRLEEIEKEKMSAKQREEYEKQKYEESLKQKETALRTTELNFHKTKHLAESKLNDKFIDIVNGDNIDNFKMNVDIINTIINDEVETRLQERLASGHKPGGTNQTNTDGIMSIDELRSIKHTDIVNLPLDKQKELNDKILKSWKHHNRS